ncbi:MAG TPA: hypothetical protein VK638_24500 [Edaphobacter sp.]|nr:hypothetical protein [Edaphobacter sp.]
MVSPVRNVFLPIFLRGTDRNLFTANVNRKIHRMREGRPFLYMTVGYELEVTALRKTGGFVTYRAIFETEVQTGGEPIAADDLEEVTHREDAALFRTQREKAVDGFLDMAHGYRLYWRTGLKAQISTAANDQRRCCVQKMFMLSSFRSRLQLT